MSDFPARIARLARRSSIMGRSWRDTRRKRCKTVLREMVQTITVIAFDRFSSSIGARTAETASTRVLCNIAFSWSIYLEVRLGGVRGGKCKCVPVDVTLGQAR